jgi:hypothetical protein
MSQENVEMVRRRWDVEWDGMNLPDA